VFYGILLFLIETFRIRSSNQNILGSNLHSYYQWWWL